MKNFALASILLSGFYLLALQSYISSLPIDLPEMLKTPEGFAGSIIFGLIVLALNIVKVIRHIQYITCLKETGEIMQDVNLQSSYKMEWYALLLSFSLVILASTYLLLFLLFDPYRGVVLGVLIIIFLGILGEILFIFLFQIFASQKLVAWAEMLTKSQPENHSLLEIFTKIKDIKLGRIISIILFIIPFANFLGSFFVIYGFWSGGNAIMNAYGGGRGNNPS